MEGRAKAKSKRSLKREFSAGGVVFRRVKEPFGKAQDKQGSKSVKTLWLVTKSTPSELYPKGIWRLPKGWLDDEGEGPGPMARGIKKTSEVELQNAALREVKEEAGVEARITAKIGTETRFFTSGDEKVMKFVTFYLMERLRDLPEGPELETSEVAWLSYQIARKRLSYSGEKRTLDKARQILKAGM